MVDCPACQRPLEEGAAECPACGLILAKRRERRPAPTPASRLSPAPPKRSPLARLLGLLALGLIGGGVVAGGYWYFKIRPRIQRIEDPFALARPQRLIELNVESDPVGDFDRTVELPADPLGLVGGEGEILIGNRAGPGGFVRLRGGEISFSAQKLPVIETEYSQKIGFHTVAWNGEQYVGLTDGAWFHDPSPQVFTLHDPETLRVERRAPAPPGLGCLAWDGTGYWASTRRHTEDASEPAHLYRLDEGFRVLSTYETPAAGCQGAAWDGERLWLVDVFSDSLYVLKILPEGPELLDSYPTNLRYLSGIASFAGEIWVSEYDDDRLHRLNPRLRRALSRTPEAPALDPASARGPCEGLWVGVVDDHRVFWNVVGSRFHGSRAGEFFAGTFELPVGEVLQGIDLEIEACDCQYDGKRALGIIRIEAETDQPRLLTLAVAEPGSDGRPSSFERQKGVALLTLLEVSGTDPLLPPDGPR